VPIRGSVSDNIPWDHGCAFAPRCPNALPVCREVQPQLAPDRAGLLRCHNPVRPAVAAGGGAR
jgi:peptide/nickel transport system ATP-binding protein